MRAATVLLVAFFIASAPAAAQPGRSAQIARDGNARLSGRVLAADTGKPLRRAVVQLATPGAVQLATPGAEGSRWVWTDADGRWQFGQVSAGRYSLIVSKSGFLTLRYGQSRPFEPGKVLEVADAQVLEKLDVSLPKGSVIAGRIHDEFGDPVSGALVRAMRYRYADGQRRLMPMAEGFDALLAGGFTDDIGHYRLHGLPPGEYYLEVRTGSPLNPPGQSDDRTGYAPSFYPGTATLADAERVTLAVGQEAQNISFAVTPIRFATISGTVSNSSGGPVLALNIWLTTAGPNAKPENRAGGSGRADGTFVIPNVPPGDYSLRIMTGAFGQQEMATMPVTVAGQDVTGLNLVIAPAATVTGRVIFEGNPPSPPRVAIEAVPAAPGDSGFHANVAHRPDGTFEIRGLWDRQIFRASAAPVGGPMDRSADASPWFLKSVTIEGKDITDSGYEFKPGQQVAGVEIVLTDRVTVVSGAVQDERGRPISDYAVVAFAADSDKWGPGTRFVRAARPDQDGKFQIKGLPPGSYQVIALEYLENGEEGDPARLEKWKTMGTRVTLEEGEAKSTIVKISR
jgi:protocatechuate 3,4-dioxygenase beta subunit